MQLDREEGQEARLILTHCVTCVNLDVGMIQVLVCRGLYSIAFGIGSKTRRQAKRSLE